MRKPNSIQVQDFFLVLTSESSLFVLEAEHQSTGRVFTINLDSDSIGQITNGLFDNVDKMVQGLKEAATSSFENIKLRISSQGKLTYTVIFASGVVKKEFGFTLNLTEKEMEPIEMFSRKLSSFKKDMEDWKEAQESKIQTLETKMETVQTFQANNERLDRPENMAIQMEQSFVQRLELLEKICRTLKASIPLRLNTSFNKTSFFASKFALADNNKTATLVFDKLHSLEILPKVPSSGQYFYSLKMNTRGQNCCYFGITSETENVYLNEDLFSYRFWAPDGRIYGRSSNEPIGNGPFGGKGFIIKMLADMDQGTLTFFVNNQQVNFCHISKSDKYSAFISLGEAGDSVTLL